MSYGANDPNPYASPSSSSYLPPHVMAQARGKVMPPAIALLVVGTVGLLVSLFNLVFAVVAKPVIDPNAPAFVQEMQKAQTGPLAIGGQSLFAVVNVMILVGTVQMLRMRSWGLAMTATILAMVNIGTCCCVVGLPFGIWSLVVLLDANVKASFVS
jgi:hypothetical protein